MVSKHATKAIAEYFKIPPDIRRRASQATWDLYYGPGCDEGEEEHPYPGFNEACAVVARWCNDTLHELWYDSMSGAVCDRKPEGYSEECCECAGSGAADHDDPDDGPCPVCDGEGERWVEPEWEDYYHFEVKAVKRALFDKELGTYI